MSYTAEQANAELRKIAEGKLPVAQAKTSKFGIGATLRTLFVKTSGSYLAQRKIVA